MKRRHDKRVARRHKLMLALHNQAWTDMDSLGPQHPDYQRARVRMLKAWENVKIACGQTYA